MSISLAYYIQSADLFENITLRRNEINGAPSPGELAQGLLYFGKVHAVLNMGELATLVSEIGIENSVRLFDRKDFTCTYVEEGLGTRCINPSLGIYDVGAFKVIQTANKKRGRTGILTEQMIRKGLDAKKSKELARKLVSKIIPVDLSSDHYVQGGIPQAAREELDLPEFAKAALADQIAAWLKCEVPADLFGIEVGRVSNGVIFLSRINWEIAAERSRQIHGRNINYTPSYALAKFFEACADMYMSSRYMGEFQTRADNALVVKRKYGNLLYRIGRETKAVTEFQNIVLDRGNAVQAVIDSGQRSFGEFLDLIETRDAKRFSKFIQDLNPDANMVKEYYEELSRIGWLETVPGKISRLALCVSTAGFTELGGLALSASDTLLVDRLSRGWRPHHFIKGKLEPFIS